MKVRVVLELEHDPEREEPVALWDWNKLLDPHNMHAADVRVLSVEEVHEKVQVLPGQQDLFQEE